MTHKSIGLALRVLAEQDRCCYHIGKRSNNNANLQHRRFLDLLFYLDSANFTGAVLRFFFMEHRIKFASQTNAEHSFKEQEYQADLTDDPGNKAG